MNVMLQNHNAKHVCDVPDGLRELCADISREVIRVQPDDVCCFVADYLDTLLITRENAKAAIKIVQNVVLKSESIVEILCGTGLKLNEIAAAAPRLQKAFRTYLDAVDTRKKECDCDDDGSEFGDENEVSLCQILRKTGASIADARRAAIKIQALFRGHYERLSLAEKRGEVQWQRAAVNTMELLRKSGVNEIEASQAATVIQAAYRGYYTRKNLKLRRGNEYGHSEAKIDAKAWLAMMFENTGLTFCQANDAAKIIQNAYRKHKKIEPKDEDELPISPKASDQVIELDSANEAEKTLEPDISIKKEPSTSETEPTNGINKPSKISLLTPKHHENNSQTCEISTDVPSDNQLNESSASKILSPAEISNNENANIQDPLNMKEEVVELTEENVKSLSENSGDEIEEEEAEKVENAVSEYINEGQDEQEDETNEIEN